MIVKINGKKIEHWDMFAYDGCHKIYIIEDLEDVKQAEEFGYTLLPIYSLESTYNNSCGLQFISNWKLTKQYVKQFEDCKIEIEEV